ncbi:MAG: peptidoglycan-binding protein, partial [Solirubrobacterales bacterium]
TSRRPRPRAPGGRPHRNAGGGAGRGLQLGQACGARADAGTGLTATSSASLGDRTLKQPMRGHDVRQLQNRLRMIGLLKVPATGRFLSLTRSAVRKFQRTRCLAVDGVAGPSTLRAIKRRAPSCASSRPGPGGGGGGGGAATRFSRTVTWYGPGWSGRRTACGQKLTSTLMGTAHKTLPCGTVVHFRYKGRRATARVVDRGPYARGVEFDLTWAVARKLGVISIGRAEVRASR